ncbi:MAG: carbohydrate kinase family protein [Candidatus Vogelbacteria bacterium]|nr:carbohydrate kinase family protein [Candidatus Vogelbacteria bacterium]
MSIFKTPNFDLVCIGDIVVDDFIRLKEARIEKARDGSNRQELCLSFGEKLPYESELLVPAVGNSPNAATAGARLGLETALVTNLGRDEHGRMCLAKLRENGVDTGFVRAHPGLKTNNHFVLWYKDDRTILIKHEEFPYELPAIGKPKWVYLSSLGEHSLPFHDIIAGYLDAQPEIKLAYQPGTYQLRFGPLKTARILRRAEYFFCNREEARAFLDTRDNEPRRLAERIADLGPRVVFITDGPAGAYIYSAKARELFFMPIYPDPKPPVSRTGAGDAFSSTVTAGAILGLTLEESLKWAMINSMSVVQQVGAQAGLLTPEKIKEYLAKAPGDFGPKTI